MKLQPARPQIDKRTSKQSSNTDNKEQTGVDEFGQDHKDGRIGFD